MKRYLMKGSVILSLIALTGGSLFAQSEKPQPRFSHKGVKFALGAGSYEMRAGEDLNERDWGLLSLGYGFSDRSTLWLSLTGGEYPKQIASNEAGWFGGLELAYQYKFRPQSRFQPYGKIGLGGYGQRDEGSNVTIAGGGLNLALGADYFFSKHFGLGIEFSMKDIEFISQSRSENGNEIVSDLNPHLNRDAGGVMFTLTIQ